MGDEFNLGKLMLPGLRGGCGRVGDGITFGIDSFSLG